MDRIDSLKKKKKKKKKKNIHVYAHIMKIDITLKSH